MHYSLLFHGTPEEFTLRTDPLRQEDYSASWTHYADALRESGILVSGAASMNRRLLLP